jgi:hypothetical protein
MNDRCFLSSESWWAAMMARTPSSACKRICTAEQNLIAAKARINRCRVG